LFIRIFLGSSGVTILQDDEDREKVLKKEDIFIYQLSSDKSNNHFKTISFVDVNEGDFVDMLLHPRKS